MGVNQMEKQESKKEELKKIIKINKERQNKIDSLMNNKPNIKTDGEIAVLDWFKELLLTIRGN